MVGYFLVMTFTGYEEGEHMKEQVVKSISKLSCFDIQDVQKDDLERVMVEVLPKRKLGYFCPLCEKTSNSHSRGNYRVLRHDWVHDGQTLLVKVPLYRQRCTTCNLTWTVKWEGIPERGQATEYYKRKVAEECILRSFGEVARDLNLPSSTVGNWFNAYQEVHTGSKSPNLVNI